MEWKAKAIKPGAKGKLSVQVIPQTKIPENEVIFSKITVSFMVQKTVIEDLGAEISLNGQKVTAAKNLFVNYMIIP